MAEHVRDFSGQHFIFIVDELSGQQRLDVYLAEQIEDASRSFIKRVIKEGRVTVNGSVCTRPARIVVTGETIAGEIPPPPTVDVEPENIPLDIVYQDSDVVVVNKPAGMVVHPAPGHYTGTLVHALLYHCPDFQRSGGDPLRPGIVHRIDRETSGLLVVAKTSRAFGPLSEQARHHEFDREYQTLVQGEFSEDAGRIEATLGRSLADPKRITVTGLQGRDAATRFRVLERFGCASLLAVVLETGRTHQIRVHLRFAGHPVLGDPVYGITDFEDWRVPASVKDALKSLHGQALHAGMLGFVHPVTGEKQVFTAALPPDFDRALTELRRWRADLPG